MYSYKGMSNQKRYRLWCNMQLFQLNYPLYDNDFEFNKENPLEILREYSVPGITCDVCGEVWSNVASRLPVDLSAESLLWSEIEKPNLKLSEHQSLRLQFEKESGIKIEPSAFPGARVGKVSIKIRKRVTSEFLWSWLPGTVFVTAEVVKALQQARIIGCLFYPVEIVNTKFEVPEIFELVITGKAGSTARNSQISIIDSCKVCGRVQYSPIIHGIYIDPENWDSSDICTITEYPTYILMSEKVKDVLESENFKNYVLTPTDRISC